MDNVTSRGKMEKVPESGLLGFWISFDGMCIFLRSWVETLNIDRDVLTGFFSALFIFVETEVTGSFLKTIQMGRLKFSFTSREHVQFILSTDEKVPEDIAELQLDTIARDFFTSMRRVYGEDWVPTPGFTIQPGLIEKYFGERLDSIVKVWGQVSGQLGLVRFRNFAEVADPIFQFLLKAMPESMKHEFFTSVREEFWFLDNLLDDFDGNILIAANSLNLTESEASTTIDGLTRTIERATDWLANAYGAEYLWNLTKGNFGDYIRDSWKRIVQVGLDGLLVSNVFFRPQTSFP